MSSETALVPQTTQGLSLGTLHGATASEIIASASDIATPLAKLIDDRQLFVTLRGRRHVKVEGWTTAAALLGVMPQEVSCTEQDGIFTSTVELVSMATGKVISRASAECGAPDEVDRDGKPMWSARPRYARKSMAATRATSKACRLAFSWIMVLGGYDPTPAEEMETIHVESTPTSAPAPVQSAPARPTPSADGLTVTTVIEKVVEKTGLTAKGKPWLMWIVTPQTGERTSTFDEKLGKLAHQVLGTHELMYYTYRPGKKDGTYDLVDLKPVGSMEVEDSPGEPTARDIFGK